MSGLRVSDPDGEAARRFEEQARRLGTRTPRCRKPGCRERNPFALTGAEPDILCYEHRAELAGRSWVEAHHVAGRHNDPTVVMVPANEHRLLNDRQRDWPQATLRNPGGSPLLRGAATLRGWLDVLWLILTRLVAWIPAALEELDRLLTETVGSRWWERLGWNPAG
ncbi:MAG: hypothetical protein JW785_06135 [Acidimicrobiia bacterium]|nr:hypothetical protein [Acidimicrobiia bacterium]